MNENTNKKLQGSVWRYYILRFVLFAVGFTVGYVVLWVVFILLTITLANTFSMSSLPSIITVPFRLIESNTILTFFIGWFIMLLVLLFLHWRKIAKDITSLVSLIEAVSQRRRALPPLPPSLKEVELQLQKVQLDALRDERIAQEAEQRKNDLVVYLAHDLKTPLTSVLGYLTLLRDEPDISEETKARYMEVATNKALKLEDLINEFFEITRFNLKGMALEPTRFNFSRMLEQVTFEFEPIFAEKNLTAEAAIEPDIELTADAGKLERVIDNLLRNAANYSYPNSAILVKAQRTPDRLMLVVQNEGDTIPPHKIARIFEQFYRVDSARGGGNDGGAGLGLAIAKEIVELHGGSIDAFSEEGIVRFTVELPI